MLFLEQIPITNVSGYEHLEKHEFSTLQTALKSMIAACIITWPSIRIPQNTCVFFQPPAQVLVFNPRREYSSHLEPRTSPVVQRLKSDVERSLCCPQVCGQCRRDLPASSYHRSKSCKDGITGKCKECCAAAISQRKADRNLESTLRSMVSSTLTGRLTGASEDSIAQVSESPPHVYITLGRNGEPITLGRNGEPITLGSNGEPCALA